MNQKSVVLWRADLGLSGRSSFSERALATVQTYQRVARHYKRRFVLCVEEPCQISTRITAWFDEIYIQKPSGFQCIKHRNGDMDEAVCPVSFTHRGWMNRMRLRLLLAEFGNQRNVQND